MFLYVKIPKVSIKLPELSDFSKAAGYKRNIQKLTAFLYTNSKHVETKIKNNAIYNYNHAKENETLRY